VPDPAILSRLEKHQGEIATSSVTWHEILIGAGIAKSARKRDLIEKYLREVVGPTIPVLPYDAHAAEAHAAERARLSRLGKTPPFADGQIAAIARVNGLALVTRNVSDFKAFEGLEIQDWRR
jgi:tRNA(fMet)-specific endonuclease VapC